jgi:SWI/SNF-related matrix-associated actin-dependent regulator 1 of chromatin subfamily A
MLVPVLRACERCILLSGTPALARPSELYPQLMILRAEQYNWWHGEAEFMDKYVKKAGKLEKAELHTMLTGTS